MKLIVSQEIHSNFITLLTIALLGNSTITYAQQDLKLKVYLSGGYQMYKDQSYQIGLALKGDKISKHCWIKTYKISNALYYERYTQPVSFENLYTLTCISDYEFKFISLGLLIRYGNIFDESLSRVDFGQTVGFGYKFIWITYATYIPIYQKNKMDLGFNNFKVKIEIPMFNIKL